MSRLIKRYDNRKLYDTENRRYVSLEELAGLIRDGADIKVIDNVSGNDITPQTLTQVIFEEGKRGRNPFSTEMLHDVIRWSNSVIDDGLQQVRSSFDQIVPSSISKLFGAAKTDEVDKLKQRIEALDNLIPQMSSIAKQSKKKQEEKSSD